MSNHELALDLTMALDPVEMAVHVGLVPDPWQANVLRSQASRILLNCSRQSGKSTMTALLALHTARYQPGALVLLLSPTMRQSGELFKKAIDLHHKLASPGEVKAESALRLELNNGSRILSLPGNETTIRGYSGVRLLAVDEAARVPDELYYSVRPMLAVSGGRLLALSTPYGNRGWWYSAWRSRDPWDRYEVPASQCPRISESFLAEERRAMGQWWFQQEYGCQFRDAEAQAFARDDIEQLFVENVEAWSLM